MDTASLERAARRYREAEAALDTARTDLQTEVVTFLQQHANERGTQATAARITGWSREHLRGLTKKAQEEAERARREAEVEALRRKVEELSTPAEATARPAAVSPQPRKPQAKPKPAVEERPLTEDEAKALAELARSRASDMQLKALEQGTERVSGSTKDYAVVALARPMGLLTDEEMYAAPEERPASSEETTT